MAHKKGMGSTKNGRDSEGKRLGAKRADGQFVLAGNILYRQRGTKMHPGTNVGIGSDDTLYAKITGIMKVERLGRDKKKISVYTKEELDAKNAAKAPTKKVAAKKVAEKKSEAATKKPAVAKKTVTKKKAVTA